MPRYVMNIEFDVKDGESAEDRAEEVLMDAANDSHFMEHEATIRLLREFTPEEKAFHESVKDRAARFQAAWHRGEDRNSPTYGDEADAKALALILDDENRTDNLVHKPKRTFNGPYPDTNESSGYDGDDPDILGY